MLPVNTCVSVAREASCCRSPEALPTLAHAASHEPDRPSWGHSVHNEAYQPSGRTHNRSGVL